jgi:hypothetical protein
VLHQEFIGIGANVHAAQRGCRRRQQRSINAGSPQNCLMALISVTLMDSTTSLTGIITGWW